MGQTQYLGLSCLPCVTQGRLENTTSMKIKELNLSQIFAELFPICRSLAGEGNNKTLDLLSEYIPLEIHSVRSGLDVFGWEVPEEWKLNRATLKDEAGNMIADTNNCNLHVVNFSEPFKGTLSLSELQKKLHSIPSMPEAIPYVTSYYKRDWGFCISDNVRNLLADVQYHVDIDVEKKPGFLKYGTARLKGSSEKEILISSYICHPSMANNELSGPLVLLALYKHLSEKKERYFNYTFLLAPETIGSICYLSKFGKQLKKELDAGFVLTCLGGPSNKLTAKLSRQHWTGSKR